MKAALVLAADGFSLLQQAGEINAMLSTMQMSFSQLELWLFYQGRPPDSFPEMDPALSAIKRIAMATDNHLPEAYLQLLMQLWEKSPMDLLVFASDGLGAELATRLGYRLHGTSCLKVEACRFTSGLLEVIKPVYGNNLTARFSLSSPPYFLSVAKRSCPPAAVTRYDQVEMETVTLIQPQYNWVIKTLALPNPPDTGLAHADRVLVVGQGVNNKETMDALRDVATTMGAEMGASRPVVMNALADMNRLIGASGLIISPKLCIAAGVTGTAVFSVGIKNSEFIVAINTDRQAPIFHVAHVGLVGDLEGILSELAKVITAEKAKKMQADVSAPTLEKS